MPAPHSVELRWMVVLKRTVLGLTWRQVSDDLCGVSKHFQSDTLALFYTTGDVRGIAHSKIRRRERRPSKMTVDLDMELLARVLDDPTAKLRDHTAHIYLSHGVSISVVTICRAMARLGLTKKKLQHYAYKRDEVKAAAFWTELMSYFSAEQMLVGDETSKDRRALRQSLGWGVRGEKVFATDSFPTRGPRVSALCLLSVLGMEDWRYTEGTYTADGFVAACRDMMFVRDAQGLRLVDRFDVLLLDNASIHHSHASFINELERYIKVLFIPPYCYHLSPLDNGV